MIDDTLAFRQLGEILVLSGVVTRRQLEVALDVQKGESNPRLLGEIITSLYHVSQERIEAIFIQDILLPVANAAYMRELSAFFASSPNPPTINFVVIRPQEYTRTTTETLVMISEFGALSTSSRSSSVSMGLKIHLDITFKDKGDIFFPTFFHYDIREKTLRIPDDELHNLWNILQEQFKG